MGCGVNKLIFGITGTEEPKKLKHKWQYILFLHFYYCDY